jgi:hypothetical protein
LRNDQITEEIHDLASRAFPAEPPEFIVRKTEEREDREDRELEDPSDFFRMRV